MDAAVTGSSTPTRASHRTHRVLGGIAGLLLGVFVWLDLVLFGVLAFESVLVYVIPVVGLVLGILIGGIGRTRRTT
jgi:hypothetical protein